MFKVHTNLTFTKQIIALLEEFSTSIFINFYKRYSFYF